MHVESSLQKSKIYPGADPEKLHWWGCETGRACMLQHF